MKMTIREALFKGIDGCSDGDCVITGRASGQQTNGGCRCLSSLSRGQLLIVQGRLKCIAYKEIEI